MRVGTTSITVRVIVEVERLGKSERVRVTEAEVIYVAVDEHGEKMAIVKQCRTYRCRISVSVPATDPAPSRLTCSIQPRLHSPQRDGRFSEVRLLLERQTIMPRRFEKLSPRFINTTQIEMRKRVRLITRR